MVTRWGMAKLGLVAFKTDEEQPFLGYELSQGRDYSEATAAEIDREVRRLLDEAHEEARRRLSASRQPLDRLVDALLQEETVGSEKLNHILGPRPQAPAEVIQPRSIASARS
jgi:cell division protease FtsH